MMASQEFITRIQEKTDTSENWAKVESTFIPLYGELIIYSDLGRMKVGDGVTTLGALSWPLGIIGPTGSRGVMGPTGSKGATGNLGPTGSQGLKGATGDRGPTGSQGLKGDTGNLGPTGSQGLKGDKGNVGPVGPTGTKGDTGNLGPTGSQGLKGATGDRGPTGSQGLKGTTGDRGPTGSQGLKGDKGDVGPTGSKGAAGNLGPTGSQGKGANNGTQLTNQNLNNYNTEALCGYYYAGGSNNVTNKPSGVDAFGLWVLRTASGYFTQELYGSNNNLNKCYMRTWTSNAWTSWVEKGATGAQGLKGDTGPKGPTGAQGSRGPVGPTGAKGDNGTPGGAGPKGPTGAQGSTGYMGSVSATTSKIYVSGVTSTEASTLYCNTSVYCSGSVLYGAAWNDYAEFRNTKEEIEPGRCVAENGDGTLSISTNRLIPGCDIVSDTFGYAIGKTDVATTPLAMTGRVLAYPYEDRDSYKPGDAVCSGPNGTISKMTRKEIINYPDRIIGTVSEIPTYDTWGAGNVSVNGRIWIRIR